MKRLLLISALFLPGACLKASAAETPRPLMRDFIGINGHTVQFKPELYQPVCSLVRDYHPIAWDLDKDSSAPAPFPQAKNKVDWSQVYGSWKKQNWTIDACLMFESMERGHWKNVAADARAYGKAFASEFGPSGKRKLVESVEIGNEPGKWSDEDYSLMFKSMAEGIREGDPAMKIATCNLTTKKSGDYEKSVSCLAGLSSLYDVLNVHTYAQMEPWPTWRRSFPEDPKLPAYLQDIEALCKWRDANAPGKPVWITEFGYDSTTQPNEPTGDFAKWVGVTDEQQAQWLVRSLLVFSTMPVQRAYLYFFNDEDKPGLHASAGLTRHFKPKPSFHALAHLQAVLGKQRFEKIVVNEAGRLRIQQYGGESGKIVWAVWSPTGSGSKFTTTLDQFPGKLVEIQRMPLAPDAATTAKPSPATPGKIELEVTESPAYLIFEGR